MTDMGVTRSFVVGFEVFFSGREIMSSAFNILLKRLEKIFLLFFKMEMVSNSFYIFITID